MIRTPTQNDSVGVNVRFVQSFITWSDGTKQYKPGVFQSLYGVKDWLEEVTGNDYFNGR